TGRPPFKAETPLDTVLLVVSEEPVPPRRLQPKVPLDAETICLKCLEKEPRKRYASAAALAEDLGRFLNHEPIHARPVGRGERLVRWCRRNPIVAGLMAIIALLLAAGTGISTYFAVLAERRAQYAEQQTLTARRDAYAADMRLAERAWEDADLDQLL